MSDVAVGHVYWIRTPHKGMFSVWHPHFLIKQQKERCLLVPVTTVRGYKMVDMAIHAPCVLVPEHAWQSSYKSYQNPVLVRGNVLKNVSMPYYRHALDWSRDRVRLEIQSGHMRLRGQVDAYVVRAMLDGVRLALEEVAATGVRRYFDCQPVPQL